LALQEKNDKAIFPAQLIQTAFVISLMVYGYIIYVSVPSYNIAIYPVDDPIITAVAVLLAILYVAGLTLGYLWPRILINLRPRNNKFALAFWSKIMPNYPRNVKALFYSVFILRAALFESIAICGLVLGILGAEWQISLPFLVVSFVAQILSFPIKLKYEKMAEKLNIATGFPPAPE
jgi:hypothetical protein